MLSLGVGLTSVPVLARRGGYDPDAAAFFARLSTPPTDARKAQYDRLFRKTKAIRPKLDELMIEAGADSQAARQNLIADQLHLTASGSPVYTADRGYTGDGVAAKLVAFTPGAGNKYQRNDASFGVWVTNQVATSAADYVLGATSTVNIRLNPRAAAATGARGRINSTGFSDVYTVRAKGLTAFRRNNAADFQVLKDGLLAGSVTAASTVTPGEITLLATDGTTFSTSTIAASWIGASLTDAEILTLTEAIAEFLNAVGALSDADYYGSFGAWTWFNEPRALVLGSDLLVGSLATDGSVMAGVLRDGLMGHQRILFPRLRNDDHCNPALLRRLSDSRFMAFYSRHSTDDNYYLQISTNPDDPTAWGNSVNLGTALGATSYTYAQPVQLDGEANDPIYLFLRCITGGQPYTMHYAKSSDGGATWGAAVRLLTGERPYFKVIRNGVSRIDVFCNDGHPGEAATNSLYHMYYEAGDWHKSDGTILGAVPYTPSSSLTRIWDGSTAAGISWVWDAAVFGSTPSVVYATFPSTSDHRYRIARYSSGVWVDTEVCAAGGSLYAGELYYSGGICFDPDNSAVLYCSRKVNGTGVIDAAGVHQIFRYVTADGGATWTGEQLTFGSNPAFRPYKPAGSNKLTYVTGRYTTYLDFDTNVVAMRVA